MKSNFADPVELYRCLQNAWSIETSSKWTSTNPANGQCSVTALVVQDIFGGELLKTETRCGTHFYNLIDGKRWDLTISQFSEPIAFDDTPATREQAFADTSAEQYRILKSRV